MKVLLLDVGSTYIKYGIYDTLNKTEVPLQKIPFPTALVDEDTLFEVSIQEIENIITQIHDAAFNQGCCKSLISVQMHGYVLKYSGKTTNYISWRDKRGDMTDPRLQNIDFCENGTALKQNLPVVGLCTFENLEQQEFYTLGSYLSYILTGNNVTHITDACASGFYHAQTLEALPIFGGLKLPEVRTSVDKIGSYRGIEIYTPMGDHQISFHGSLAGDDKYLLNIGTASQICTLASDYELYNGCEKRPYFSRKERLLTISGITGGYQLYGQQDSSHFLREVLEAVQKLPKRNEMLLGGGGAEIVYDEVRLYMEKHGIQCKKIEKNIGLEGLKMIADEICKPKVGTMLSELHFANFPILMKHCGLDFFIIDNEHGAFEYSMMASLILNSRLCGMDGIIRLPDNSRSNITKFADMGAQGFLLPMTNTAEDIKTVVQYAKYRPIGQRGISTNRAHTLYNPPKLDVYTKDANSKMKVYAQIETIDGCNNIEEILNTEGVDGVFIGPNDLSSELDCLGETEPLFPYIERIAAAAQAANKPWGIITTSAKLINHAKEHHVNFISYGSEINMLKNEGKKIREVL